MILAVGTSVVRRARSCTHKRPSGNVPKWYISGKVKLRVSTREGDSDVKETVGAFVGCSEVAASVLGGLVAPRGTG
jgi:hypothetical protein